jgi:hypothetical protein
MLSLDLPIPDAVIFLAQTCKFRDPSLQVKSWDMGPKAICLQLSFLALVSAAS